MLAVHLANTKSITIAADDQLRIEVDSVAGHDAGSGAAGTTAYRCRPRVLAPVAAGAVELRGVVFGAVELYDRGIVPRPGHMARYRLSWGA